MVPRTLPSSHVSQNTACISNGETESGRRQCCWASDHSVPRAEIPGADFSSRLEHPSSGCWPVTARPACQILQKCRLLIPWARPSGWWEGRVQPLCAFWICGSFPAQPQAGTRSLLNTSFSTWVFAVSLPTSSRGGHARVYKCLEGTCWRHLRQEPPRPRVAKGPPQRPWRLPGL